MPETDNFSPEINSQSVAQEIPVVSPPPTNVTPANNSNLRNKIVITSVLLLLVLILSAAGLYYYQLYSAKNALNTSTSDTESPLPSAIADVVPSVPLEELSVEFSERQKVFETVKVDSTLYADIAPEANILDEYTFYKIGTVTSGKYAGGELLLVYLKSDGFCKGESCGKPTRLRYIKNDTVVTYLPNVSPPTSEDAVDFLTVNPFKEFGLTLESDASVTIPLLEYPEKIAGPNQRQVLKANGYHMEEDGEIDLSKLSYVFTDPIFGDIYTTKAEFGLISSAEGDSQGGEFGTGLGLYGCRDTDCFKTNQFFAFRPDGTFIKFGYEPDIAVDEIVWLDTKKVGEEYKPYTAIGCQPLRVNDNSVIAPSQVSDEDLVIVGNVSSSGDAIYGLKDENHALYTQYYNEYTKYFTDFQAPEEKSVAKSYTEFLEARPLFFWRDPFGRLIRYSSTEFLAPAFCEPIIYLYPQQRQSVSVRLDKVVTLTSTTPVYQNGWNVIADPSGRILNPADNRAYPYLFWEGRSFIFPLQQEGFVVKQSDVPGFLERTLAQLGLNENEKIDFMEAWLPDFTDSPYYFITFIKQSDIDRLAPLYISPKPETVIRVLMDTKPLEQPITVVEPEFESVPERTGFTVVEWGGLKR